MKLMYINGEFTKGNSEGEIEVTNPATEEVIGLVPDANLDDTERARWARASAEGIGHYRVERMVAETVALYRTFR